MRLSLLWAACLVPLAVGQSSNFLPGCDPDPEVHRILEEKLDPKGLEKLKHAERVQRTYQVLGDLIGQYPRAVEPHRRLIQSGRLSDPKRFPSILERYRTQAATNPDDPLAVYLAGAALYRTDTDESICMLEQALAEAPDFPWPALQLAEIYAGGKRVDKKKAADYIAAFFALCPDSAGRQAHWILSKSRASEVQAKVARVLRERLVKEADPKRLREFEILWGLEFRTRPPQEHGPLRKQVAKDVKRLESLNPSPDAGWLAFLKKAYKQSGASPETTAALDELILREFPTSLEAFLIASERWRKENKVPDDHGEAEAWKKYQENYRAVVNKWRQRFSEVHFLEHLYFTAVSADETISKEEGLAALEGYLKFIEKQPPEPYNYLRAAEFLIDHEWQLDRALALLQTGHAVIPEGFKARWLQNDDLPDDERDRMEKALEGTRVGIEGTIVKAAILAGRPDAVESIRSSIEVPIPEDKKAKSTYWHHRGLLAYLEGRKADALTYYQSALHARLVRPRPRRGRVRDFLTGDAKALWKELGGTEEAWAMWSKPAVPKVEELTEGRWKKATKQLPAFEIADLSGNIWRLESLEGKSVLINLWATWCGPCQAELPKLQELYDEVKDRKDLQIITLNIDEELGLVDPFLKEKGYTFPVLSAYNFVLGLLDLVGIPQNWIIDPTGKWRWTQFGYESSAENWVESMIRRLESVKQVEK